MTTRPPPHRRSVVAAVIVGAFVLASASASGATPRSEPHASGSLPQWAYGANRTTDESGPMGNGTYDVSTAFAYHVLFNQSSPGGSAVSVEVRRTAGEAFVFSMCVPDCGSARFSADVSSRAWETEDAFANFSTAGSVTANGTGVPALALVNASASMRSNLTETVTWSVHPVLGGVRTAHASLSVGAVTEVSAAFAPALGLIPLSVTPGEKWTAQSVATTSGAWSVRYSFMNSTLLGIENRESGHPSGSLQGSQTIGLRGEDVGPVALTAGLAVQAVALDLNGSFRAREGFILLPGQSDLFGVSHGPWESLEAGSETAATTTVDYSGGSDHIGLIASATSFSGATTNATPATPPGPLARPQTGAAGVVQAEPEPYSVGASASQCLVAGCPTGGANGPAASPLPGLALVGLALGAVVVVSGVVVVQRRREIPEPPRASSGGYPAAVLAAGDAPLRPRPPEGVEPPVDPLDHLW